MGQPAFVGCDVHTSLAAAGTAVPYRPGYGPLACGPQVCVSRRAQGSWGCPLRVWLETPQDFTAAHLLRLPP